MSDDVFAPGDVLGGKYRVVRALGTGGMAVVLEAVHLRLGHRAALKVLRQRLAEDAAIVERFEREGRALSRLRSANVVRVFDVDATPAGAPFLVMEYLDGEDLETELRRRGRLPAGEAVGCVLQACTAMQEVHDLGIVHRDLKPANLFLAKEGATRVVKVLDFGIARGALPEGDARLTRTESVMGTPLYMAPEQFRSTRDVDARADVWALGATLYELLSGHPPFVGTTSTIGVAVVTEDVRPFAAHGVDVPPALSDAVLRALQKDREARFPSMRAFADALRPFSDGVVIAPRASTASYPDTVGMMSAQTLLAGPTLASAGERTAATPATGPAVTNDTTHPTPAPRSRAARAWPFFVVTILVGGAALLALRRSSPPSPPATITALPAPPPLPSPSTTSSPPPVALPSASASTTPPVASDVPDASLAVHHRRGRPSPGSSSGTSKPAAPDPSGHPLFFPP